MKLVIFATVATALAGQARPPEMIPDFSIELADYPVEEWRAGHEGRVDILLDVDRAGVPTYCVIAVSSDYPALDTATCQVAMARMRFRPALDADGVPVAATANKSILWKINRNAGR